MTSRKAVRPVGPSTKESSHLPVTDFILTKKHALYIAIRYTYIKTYLEHFGTIMNHTNGDLGIFGGGYT